MRLNNIETLNPPSFERHDFTSISKTQIAVSTIGRSDLCHRRWCCSASVAGAVLRFATNDIPTIISGKSYSLTLFLPVEKQRALMTELVNGQRTVWYNPSCLAGTAPEALLMHLMPRQSFAISGDELTFRNFEPGSVRDDDLDGAAGGGSRVW